MQARGQQEAGNDWQQSVEMGVTKGGMSERAEGAELVAYFCAFAIN